MLEMARRMITRSGALDGTDRVSQSEEKVSPAGILATVFLLERVVKTPIG